MDSFIGEVRLFANNFVPQGWFFCEGQLLSISSNTELFSVIGTTYGGNGTTTFGLPNLRGRGTLGASDKYRLGAQSGVIEVFLEETNLPTHRHTFNAATGGSVSAHTSAAGAANKSMLSNFTVTPAGTTAAKGENGYVPTDSDPTFLNPESMELTGQSAAHPNMQPYITLNYCICVKGYFPARP